MEITVGEEIVYGNDHGVIWIQTDQEEPAISEMPTTSDDSDSPDPLNVRISDNSNDSCSKRGNDPYSAVPLKSFSRHYYEMNDIRKKKSRTYICAYCGLTHFIRKEIKDHILNSHGYNLSMFPRNYREGLLKVWEPTPDRICRNINYLKISRVFFCSHCSYRTVIPICMKTHLENFHSKAGYLCPLCAFKTSDIAVLKLHHSSLHEVIRFRYCPHCTFKTKSAQKLNEHVTGTHSENHCNHCVYQADDNDKLNHHMEVQHRHEFMEQMFQCDQCSYRSYEKRYLNRHKSTVHVERNICPHCTYRAFTKEELVVHVVTEHGAWLVNFNQNSK